MSKTTKQTAKAKEEEKGRTPPTPQMGKTTTTKGKKEDEGESLHCRRSVRRTAVEAEESIGGDNPIPTPELTSIEGARALIQELCTARRFCDAALIMEEWYLQGLDAAFEAEKPALIEELNKDTFMKFWLSAEANRAFRLLSVSAVQLIQSKQNISVEGANRRLDELRGFDTIIVERDHVIECLRGLYASASGKLEDAEQYLLEALRQNPRMAFAYKLLGDVYLRRHRPSLAWACWQHARMLCPALLTSPLELNITQAEASLKQSIAPLLGSKSSTVKS